MRAVPACGGGCAPDALLAAGPARGGVYSPSVQATLYGMGRAALSSAPGVESITLTCPNIHFLPVLPAGIPFANDVYVATSEPHGTIKATVARTAPGCTALASRL